ncbi:uncharacterized protein SCHCODRAFT_02642090 [Schizophyllum commune H4-8]|uniref:uncharacterized protein n=1 Tax=Schizophyllum commune (strain H4-8 / FGSC 9210) TaxID=578458 RepID=UPI0021607302|nr:uncharacterized protein SCHCODRAFT_02642090 [Schizophyllum commune H4-8]KAI5886589.1 hypothetical protein SCHCODRAFT_02642090 [Schizophyllum commune H4-8]
MQQKDLSTRLPGLALLEIASTSRMGAIHLRQILRLVGLLLVSSAFPSSSRQHHPLLVSHPLCPRHHQDPSDPLILCYVDLVGYLGNI